MFLNYLVIIIFIIHLSCCVCYVGYDQFPGFDKLDKIGNGIKPPEETIYRKQATYSARHRKMTPTAAPHKATKMKIPTSTSTKGLKPIKALKEYIYKEVYDRILQGRSHETTTEMSQDMEWEERVGRTLPTPKETTRTEEIMTTLTTTSTNRTETTKPLVMPLKHLKFNCTETERPFNIGTYEVPTQRDVMLQIKKTLIRMFGQYREKALDFLQDIQQAKDATSDIEKKCRSIHHNHRRNYKKCVKEVSRKCEYITKSLVVSLERQRADVSAFIEGTICNGTEMKADPLELIKSLAMELASLEFALPGFLRLLGSCSAYCDTSLPATVRRKKPLRHMTDQDLVVKHFLTKKSYVQLIN